MTHDVFEAGWRFGPLRLRQGRADCLQVLGNDLTVACVQGRVEHKGPLVPTAADSFVLKAVVTGERGTLALLYSRTVTSCL